MEQGLLTLEELTLSQLSDYIGGLIDKDFNALLLLLYRLDVSEEKLRNTLHENPEGNPADMIALLIVERISQREKAKKEMKPNTDPIPDDEKW